MVDVQPSAWLVHAMIGRWQARLLCPWWNQEHAQAIRELGIDHDQRQRSDLARTSAIRNAVTLRSLAPWRPGWMYSSAIQSEDQSSVGGDKAAHTKVDHGVDLHVIVVAGMPPLAQDTDILFYDGYCVLCHSAVKFVVKHDRSGTAFRFAPLNGKTFEATVPVNQRSELSNSMVVRTDEGLLLMRSNALVHILQRLGGKWKIVATAVAVIPRPLRDMFYNVIARIRYRVFERRDHLCPVVPGNLRARFDP